MKTFITTIAVLLLNSSLAFAQENIQGNAIHPMGVELYARFDKGKNLWLFGMLPGTNRQKGEDEVNQSMTLKGVDALLGEMKRLAPQETVFLVPSDYDGHDLTPLDEETQKKLAGFCAKHEIVLQGNGKFLNQPNLRIAAMEASASRRDFVLSKCLTDETGLAMISEKFPALESLDLSYCGLGDGDFSSMGKLKSLTTLIFQ